MRSRGVIIAYEPFSDNFRLLARNIAINNLVGRVVASPLAVAGRRGSRELFVGTTDLFHSLERGSLSTSTTVRVECITLADVSSGMG